MLVQERPADAPETKTPRKKSTRQTAEQPLPALPGDALPEASVPPVTTMEDLSRCWHEQTSLLRTAALSGNLNGIVAAQSRLAALPFLAAGLLHGGFAALEKQFGAESERWQGAQADLVRANAALSEIMRQRGESLPPAARSQVESSRERMTRLRAHSEEIQQYQMRCRQNQTAADALLQRVTSTAPHEMQGEIQRLVGEMREFEARLVSIQGWLDQYLQAKGQIAP